MPCAVSRGCVSPPQGAAIRGNIAGSADLPGGESQREPQHVGKADKSQRRCATTSRKTRTPWSRLHSLKSSSDSVFVSLLEKRPATTSFIACAHCSSVAMMSRLPARWQPSGDERGPTRDFKERTDDLQSARYVHSRRNTGMPTGGDAYGIGATIVVSGWESQLQGEG
jgi:hypothetical protein